MLVTNNNLDFFLIARSGQCFRMHAEGDTVFLRTGSRFLTIHDLGQGVLDLSCTEEEFPFWSHYLDLHGPYARAIRAIPPEDTYLLSCVSACRGLHLLRQDPFETLISFILSQRKSIPAIEQCVEKLCMLCGEADDSGYAFPTPQALAACTEEELRGCALGYRAPYVLETARLLCTSPLPPPNTRLSDEKLLSRLLAFPGVGIKVASCVLLFAYHRLGSAPVDVWIQRVIDRHYGGVNPFPALGPYAGLYQQYMFCHARLFEHPEGSG